MVKHLYVIRHGQTLFNVRRRIQGWCDSPLTELGKKQILAAKELLKEIPFDHYYSSTSERCCDTMEMIIGDQSYIRNKDLREYNFGMFEGESEDLHPTWENGFSEMYPKYGGETVESFGQRVSKALMEIIQKEDHYCVLVTSSSGSIIQSARQLVGEEKVEEYAKNFPNCGIIHYEIIDNTWVLKEILKPVIGE